MRRILASEGCRFFRSKATYLFLACIVLFCFILFYDFGQTPFTTAEAYWNSLDSLDQSLLKLAYGLRDGENFFADLTLYRFRSLLYPDYWLILAAAFVIFLFGRDSAARRFDPPLYQGHSRVRVQLSRFLFYDAVVLTFGLLLTVFLAFLTNLGWTSLPAGYLLRCYGLFVLALVQFGGLFLLLQACIPSSGAASAVMAVLCFAVLFIKNQRSVGGMKAANVLFPLISGYEDETIWDAALSPALTRELLLRVAWSVALLVICHAASVLVFKKRELT